MMMRKALMVVAAAGMTQLAGCWFVFIPGSLIQKVADGVTGAEGDHCVGPNAKIGDTIMLSNGRTGRVRSLSGTSARCQQPEYPIRAALDIVG